MTPAAVRLGEAMTKDARDLIAYLQKVRAVEREDIAGVEITEAAAFNIILELQSLCERIVQAEQDIRELIAERDRLEDALEDRE
jgi:cell division protein ZapA (FtsZ GTPase activity inhibitor)